MRVRMAQRILWLSVVALLLFSGLGYRLYGYQIGRHQELVEAVHSQRTQALPLQMRRGRILDRNGVVLTDPASSFGVGLFPRLMGDLEAVERQLARLLSPAQLAQVLAYARSTREPGWVGESLTARQAEQVRALGLPGIVVGPTGQRYGHGSLARHLVGFASDRQGGKLGLEAAFEQQLYGRNVPHYLAAFDGRGRPLFPEGIRRVEPRDPAGKQPYDLFTTLDAGVQGAVEAAMDRTFHPVGGPLRGAVVVLDVQTGEPLAIASRPQLNQREGTGDQTNRALIPYELGSVFKPLVAAWALEQERVTPEERFECQGHYDLGKLSFRDAGGKAHGSVRLQEAIAWSCNVAFIQIGYERLGRTELLEAARRFGLDRPTGLYPGAEEPVAPLPALPYGGDVAQFSFGQAGLMASPLQVARAYAALANGGVLPPVRLVTAVRDPSGVVMDQPPPAERPQRVISPETAREVQEALGAVTDPRGQGTGRAAWLERFGAAGKTGSAETAREGRPVTHAWFAGWVPARQPRYVIVVLIEDGQAGGLYAAPLFRRIGEALLGV
ncbi:MAG: peptidoglycan D,D-transpeptidase FtsI family protein [Bacillota bacterium]